MSVSSSPPALGRLLGAEARQKVGTLLAGAILVLLLDLFIVWRVENPQLKMLVAMVVALVPGVYWLFGGVTAFWAEFGSGAHLTLRGVPGRGMTVVTAKYAWLMIEVIVLFALLLGSALFFLNGVVPLAEVRFNPNGAAQLLLLGFTALLVPPAIAVAAGVIGRASRLRLFGGLLAFGLLWWAYLLLGQAAMNTQVLGEVRFAFASLPREFCTVREGCALQVSTALLVLQPLFALVTLWVAARAFEKIDR